MPSCGDRIGAVTEALALAAPDGFDLEPIETRAGSGDRCVRFQPRRTDAPALLVTDTGVSWYFEVPEARWEVDSSDATLGDQSVQCQWAVETARNIAKFGIVRTRPRWMPFGRESFVLSSDAELLKFRADRSIRIIGFLPPWTRGAGVGTESS